MREQADGDDDVSKELQVDAKDGYSSNGRKSEDGLTEFHGV